MYEEVDGVEEEEEEQKYNIFDSMAMNLLNVYFCCLHECQTIIFLCFPLWSTVLVNYDSK